jgi:hypothetical protein
MHHVQNITIDPEYNQAYQYDSMFEGSPPPLESTTEGEGFRKLGKKNIHVGKLMKSNKLDVRNQKNGSIYGFPVATVSNLFVSHVNNLMNNKSV